MFLSWKGHRQTGVFLYILKEGYLEKSSNAGYFCGIVSRDTAAGSH